jgi:2-dehydro-3-deoxygluconokinase
MAELLTFGDTALELSPRESERFATARDARQHASGIESGAAAAATAVGADGTWVSRLPDAAPSRRVVGQLREHGVATDVTWVDPDDARQGLVFREHGRDPREEAVVYDWQGTAVAAGGAEDLPTERVRAADTVFVGASTAVLSEPAGETVGAVLRAAREAGVTTALAVDYRPGLRPVERYRETLADLIASVDVLVVGDAHAETVFGKTGRPRTLANTLAAELDLATVVVTHPDGSAVALDVSPGTNVVHEQSPPETNVVSTTGRQAALMGGLLGRLADGAPLDEALTDGVAAAALACTVSGPLLTATPGELSGVAARMADR